MIRRFNFGIPDPRRERRFIEQIEKRPEITRFVDVQDMATGLCFKVTPQRAVQLYKLQDATITCMDGDEGGGCVLPCDHLERHRSARDAAVAREIGWREGDRS